MSNKNIRTALLLLLLLLGCLAALYFLLKIPASVPAGLMALLLAIVAIGLYAANLIFLGKLIAENSSMPGSNRVALRISLVTILFPLLALIVFYSTI